MNRNIYRPLVIAIFVGVLVSLLFGISQVIAYANTGADRSSMLHTALYKEKKYLPKVQWKDTTNPGRTLEKQSMLDIQEDYMNAWYVRHMAFQTNQLTGLNDYYTKNAKQNIVDLIDLNASNQITLQSTTLNHNINLDFYSADGKLAVIRDLGVKEFNRFYKNGAFLKETSSLSNYKVLLLLEDGFWRIRHIIKEAHSKTKQNKISSEPFAKIIHNKIYINGTEFQIKGINYYPQKHPWNMFGDTFNIETIEDDFDLIKKATLNTIRIFVPYEAFGKAQVNEGMVQQLRKILDTALTKDLKVIVTLFDFYGNYDLSDWTLTLKHATHIVNSFKGHQAILAWDIKNEPDLDFESRGKVNVLAWLKQMITLLRQLDSNHLYTIGWSNTKAATLLKGDVDFVSFHYYKDIDHFSEKFQLLNNQITKPLVLQEFGISSNQGIWAPFGATEDQQAAYHQTFQGLIKELGLHFVSWTLYDFDHVPASVVGRLPWRKNKQKHFGFINRQGKKKKAFSYISN